MRIKQDSLPRGERRFQGIWWMRQRDVREI